jgi:branched-chain amino acid transport system ATP-binding protein
VARNVLVIEGLEAGYGDVQVLWGVSLEVPEGQITTMIGANGAGKTTTLRAVVGSVPVRRGRVLLEGEDVSRLSPHEKVRLGMTLVPEGRQIFSNLSVSENLSMGAFSRHTTRAATSTASTPCSPAWASVRVRSPARCPAASSRCSPSAAP